MKINVMDRDGLGVKALVIKRGNTVIEEINRPGKGVLERTFSTCGDYTAHCVMNDGSTSQACEFAVCDFDFSLPVREVSRASGPSSVSKDISTGKRSSRVA